MPTKRRLIISNLLWTVALIIVAAAAARARTYGLDIPAEINVALYIMLAFPSGLGWYDYSIGKYRGGPAA